MSNSSVPAEHPAPAPDRRLLRGGAEITEFIIKRKVDRPDIRWLYGKLDHFIGVIWRFSEDGELVAWTDELTEHLEMMKEAAKTATLAVAEAKAAEKEELRKTAAKSAAPKSAPAQSRKSKVTAARKPPVRKPATPRQSKSLEPVD